MHLTYLKPILLLAILAVCHLSIADDIETNLERNLNIRQSLKDYEVNPGTMYAMAFEDLNGDKKVEALVFLTGSHWCGSGGCTLLVLAEKQEQWTVQSKIPTSRLPLYALESKSNGWQDISVLVVGGGRMKAGHAVVTFEKQKAKYVKSKKVIDIEPVNEKIVLSRKPAYQTL